MDVQVQAVSTSASATTAARKTGSAESASTEGFSQALDGQLEQDQAAGDVNSADPALSLEMLLQMLQSLVMPLGGAVEEDAAAEEQSLPEAVLEVMNNNPALADQLLQDPNVQKWFADAQQLLQSFGETAETAGLSLSNRLDLQTAEVSSLEAQNTLLTLASLTKKLPENPILKFLVQDLQETIQPLLPELMTGVKGQSLETAAHKLAGKQSVDQGLEDVDSLTIIQPSKSKLELLAMRNVLQAPFLEQTSNQQESLPQLVDFPAEVEGITNTVVTAGDLQKAQLAAMPADKTAPAVLNASNFADEMTEHVLKNMKVTLSEGFSEAKLSLFPKNLGHIDVRISMHDGQLIAQFAADSLAAKQMLENQLPQLRQALLTQGLQVEKLEVTQSPNMQSGMFQEQRQQQSFNQSQRQNKNGSGNYNVESLDFDQEVDQVAQVRTSVNGNSFDVIA